MCLLDCHQCASLQLDALHQSGSQEYRTQSSCTLFENVLSSRRSQQAPAPLENFNVTIETRTWFFNHDPAPFPKNSGIITKWMMLLLVELDIPTPPGVEWTGHSLRRGGATAAHAIGVSIAVIMAWAYGKLSLQHSSTLTSLCGRLLKLCSSSATCLRASIFL